MSNWTGEQQQAIEQREEQMLVSAAAGSGKTSVLVERIIRRITAPKDPLDVDRLLVVTFTNGAASEMRERISAAINAALEQNPGALYLRRQLALLQRAAISTMHSFCLDVIRQYFYRLELDPVFRVMDETEAALLQQDVLEEVLEARYSQGETGFLQLVDCYGGAKDDGGVRELVLELFRFSRSTPRPDAWLEGLPGAFDFPGDAAVDSLPWFRVLTEAVRHETAGAMAMVEQALRLAARPGGPAPYLDTLEQDRELIRRLARACDAGWAQLHGAFGGLAFTKLARCRKDEADPGLTATVKKIRDGMKKRLQTVQKKYFHRPPEHLLEELRGLAATAQTLSGLVRDFGACYRRAKLERGVVDFNDLEHYALEILSAPTGVDDGRLRPSSVALELRQRFSEVLVDEYQDINAVQESILQLVAGEGQGGPGLFMVGDVKQSIYRFRLAEPGLFLAKYNRFSTGDGAGCLVNLTRNFRSRRGVVEAVNHVFRRIMTPAVGEMEYDQRAELVYGACYPPAAGELADELETVELHLLENQTPAAAGEDTGGTMEDETAGSGADVEDLDAVQVEARAVARRINDLVDARYPVYDRSAGRYRPVTYRDVVVLMRATTGRANTFVEEFRKLGVPAYAELTTGYFEATEVEMVLALLKVIDNPRQDVPLAAVLRSPAAGFSSDDLALIRLAGGRGDFYDAVVRASREGPEELARRLTQFLSRLDEWRTRARQSGLPSLIWSLYRETGLYDYVGGLPGGSQRQANLRVLYHRAEQFEATSYRGLARFLRFIERLRDGEGDMGTARSLGENENVVRIMSIHKSKGLEFPVVIVAGLGKRFNTSGLNGNMLMHRELGLGPQLVDPVKRITYPTVAKLAVQEKLRAEALAEEMRLLYVAMTRAREKLILVGSVSGLEAAAVRWCGAAGMDSVPLPVWMTIQAGTCLDWLCPCLAGHPGGMPLRKLAGLDATGPVPEGEYLPRWLVRVYSPGSPGQDAPSTPAAAYRDAVRSLQPVPLSGPRAADVKARLDWSYPYRGLQGLTARATVTGLKNAALRGGEGDEHRVTFSARTAARPAFVQQREGLDAAGRGQALHLVMQLLDLEGDLSADGVRDQLAVMVDNQQVTPAQAAAVDPEAVAMFFAVPLGRRVLSARRVYREQPFTLALPVKTMLPGTEGTPAGEETVLVQGIIDCLLEEDDGLVVVDYKTDRYTPENLPAMVERYRFQLDLYSHAARVLTGRPVTARYLYLFYRGDAISM